MPSVKPFSEAIIIVNDIESAVKTLNSPTIQHPISDVITILGDVIEALGLVNDIDDVWDVITDALNALDGVTDVITAFCEVIPGVDVVVDVIDGIVDVIDGIDNAFQETLDSVTEVVDEVVPILKDIHTGLKDLDDFLKDIGSELPALVNTMKILQALDEIVEVIAPLFKKIAGQTPVVKRLETVRKEYATVDAGFKKAASPLKSGLDDVEKAIKPISNSLSSLQPFVSGVFGKIETDVEWVAHKIDDVAHIAKSIAHALAPVRWILHAVSSIFKKLIGPIISKIEDILGITALKKKLIGEIKKKLDFSAITAFEKYNGTGKGKKTNIFGKQQANSGSHKSKAIKDFWDDVEKSVKDYKRGNKQGAVENAVQALIDAITGGKIDLNSMPPKITRKTLKLYVPKVTPGPKALEFEEQIIEARLIAIENCKSQKLPPQTRMILNHCNQNSLKASTQSSAMAAAQAQIKTAIAITKDAGGSNSDLLALNNAAQKSFTKMSTVSPAFAPAAKSLGDVSIFTRSPNNGRPEIASLSNLATSISDILSRLIDICPNETKSLKPFEKELATVAARLGALSKKEAALASIINACPKQVATTLKEITYVQGVPAHANAVSGIAVSGSSISQLLTMMDKLNVDLNHTHDSDMSSLHKMVDKAAVAETSILNGMVTDVQTISRSLNSIETASSDLLDFYKDLAKWSAPVPLHWLPILNDTASYIRAVDSIITPLSYLLKLDGCTTKSSPRSTKDAVLVGNVATIIRKDAMDAADYMAKAAVALLDDIFKELPKRLGLITEKALFLDEMDSLLKNADQRIKNNMKILDAASTQIKTSLSDVAKATKPPKTYKWKYTYKHKTKTIEISNAFISDADAKRIGVLATQMITTAINQNIQLPNASPLIQSWRTKMMDIENLVDLDLERLGSSDLMSGLIYSEYDDEILEALGTTSNKQEIKHLRQAAWAIYGFGNALVLADSKITSAHKSGKISTSTFHLLDAAVNSVEGFCNPVNNFLGVWVKALQTGKWAPVQIPMPPKIDPSADSLKAIIAAIKGFVNAAIIQFSGSPHGAKMANALSALESGLDNMVKVIQKDYPSLLK